MEEVNNNNNYNLTMSNNSSTDSHFDHQHREEVTGCFPRKNSTGCFRYVPTITCWKFVIQAAISLLIICFSLTMLSVNMEYLIQKEGFLSIILSLLFLVIGFWMEAPKNKNGKQI